jgi:hypothetical protein
MAKYAGEIADLFSHMELQQIKLFVEKLSVEEIKLLHAVVLPKINSLGHRRVLKQP